MEKRNLQQEAPTVLPLKPKIPPSIAPITHRYPFRHRRQQQLTVSSARYANAVKHIYNLEANAVLNPLTGVLQEFCHLIKGPDKEIWTTYLANKFGRLAQVVSKRIDGTNTIYFIPKEEVPFKTKKGTYPKIVCDIRSSKAETHRTRITVGGNLLDYTGTLTTPTATITTAKCLFNSVVSTPAAKFVLADIKKFLPQQSFPRSRVYEIPYSNYTTGNH